MMTTRAVERHIVAQLLNNRRAARRVPLTGLVICGLALAAGTALLLAFLPGLPWVALAVSLLLCLGLR